MVQFFQNSAFQGICHKLSLFFCRDQPRLLAEVQWMGNAGFGNVEMFGDRPWNQGAMFGELDDFPAGRVVTGLEKYIP